METQLGAAVGVVEFDLMCKVLGHNKQRLLNFSNPWNPRDEIKCIRCNQQFEVPTVFEKRLDFSGW